MLLRNGRVSCNPMIRTVAVQGYRSLRELVLLLGQLSVRPKEQFCLALDHAR